jgi:hypothetical protein
MRSQDRPALGSGVSRLIALGRWKKFSTLNEQIRTPAPCPLTMSPFSPREQDTTIRCAAPPLLALGRRP